jgi:hypothetical protein
VESAADSDPGANAGDDAHTDADSGTRAKETKTEGLTPIEN